MVIFASHAQEVSTEMVMNGPIQEFGSGLERGLSSGEVQKRISEYGYNEVPEKRVSTIIGFVKKFWGMTPWMLEITIE